MENMIWRAGGCCVQLPSNVFACTHAYTITSLNVSESLAQTVLLQVHKSSSRGFSQPRGEEANQQHPNSGTGFVMRHSQS